MSSEELPKTKDIVKAVFSEVKEYSKLTKEIPLNDYDYHMAFPGFRKQINRHSEVLIGLMDKCCQLIPAKRRVTLQENNGKLSDLQRAAVMEAVDSLLENVDSLLDDLKGKRLSAKDQLSLTFGSELQGSSSSSFAGVNVVRPQLTFEQPVDNSSTPFCPIYYDEKGEKHVAKPGVHPFLDLIKNSPIPEDQLLRRAETPYLPLTTCPLQFIDNVEDLREVIKTLLQEKEIALDLEHHDFYSYQGFTCLMQISTRTEDFIIDCLKLRSSMYLLAPVFLNSRILKVLHGAREDIRWLQKDFGLYLVNFFDTGIALQELHMPYSLAFAVDHFCQVKLNKKYQTADWRIRPIPAEMIAYARQDTHFLLYVYDRLKDLLLNTEGRASTGNMLLHVLHESRRLSLELYEKPQLDPDNTYKLALGRSLGGLTPSQIQVARDIFNWRDAAAREVDDSPAAIMHLSSVLSIATKLPTSANEILKCCSPISVVTRTNVLKLLQIVKDAIGHVANLEKKENNENNEIKSEVPSRHAAAFARPAGVHRPMTGTLPSIQHTGELVLMIPNNNNNNNNNISETVVRWGPSAWFETTRGLAEILRRRPQPFIKLPGHEVTLMLRTRAAEKRARELAKEKKEKEEGEKVGEDNNNNNNNNNEEEEEENNNNNNGETCDCSELDKSSSVQPMELEERAVALRKQYGTGTANRKRAKVEKVKGSKNE